MNGEPIKNMPRNTIWELPTRYTTSGAQVMNVTYRSKLNSH